MVNQSLLFLVLIGVLSPLVTANIKCYTCVTSEADLTCLENPELVNIGSPITDCNKDCCTIYRQEYIEQSGVVASFSRGCQNNCKKDGVYELEDSYFRTYWTYCSEPMCNKGDGSDGSNVGGGGGDNGNFIDGILGTGRGTINQVSYSAVLLSFVILFLARP